MRYRKLQGFGQGVPSDGGDYSFGLNADDFFVDSPTTVAQAVLTALMLHRGEWFLDTTVGMPWETEVLGYNTQSLYDAAIKQTILRVEGVLAIEQYSSSLDTVTRFLTVIVVLDTIYGTIGLAASQGTSGLWGIGPWGEFPWGS